MARGNLRRDMLHSPRNGTIPTAGRSKSHIGTVGELERVVEDKVEMIIFGKETVVSAVKALREAHPYEIVAYYVTKTEDI